MSQSSAQSYGISQYKMFSILQNYRNEVVGLKIDFHYRKHHVFGRFKNIGIISSLNRGLLENFAIYSENIREISERAFCSHASKM